MRLGMLREGMCSEGPWVQNQLSDYIKEVMHFPALQPRRSWDAPQEGKGMPSVAKLPGIDSPYPWRVTL